MERLSQSKIKPVWDIFRELSAIPRGSGNERAVSDWIVAFCARHGLRAKQDKLNNIFVTKPASAGYENYAPIICQGHIDMVNEKTPSSKHDFAHDPINLRVVDGCLTADDTTLGADNGIGVAFILAAMTDDNLPHPTLEVIFTTEEETTMAGAKGFDYSQISGRRLISLDHVREGEVLTACAGLAKLRIDGAFDLQDAPDGYDAIEISLTGLRGGHSGNDIILRASAFDFLARTIEHLCASGDIMISRIECGSKPNAIARDFALRIFAPAGATPDIGAIAQTLESEFNAEISACVESVSMKIAAAAARDKKCLTADATNRLKDMLIAMPNGVQTLSDIPDVAESSLNIGRVMMEDGRIEFGITVRSSVQKLEESIVDNLKNTSKKFGQKMTVEATSPMFSSAGSPLAKFCMETYARMFGKPMIERRVHAIVEAGVLQSGIPGLDVVLIAPDLFDIHSPSERLDIASTERTWDFFTELLASAKFSE